MLFLNAKIKLKVLKNILKSIKKLLLLKFERN